MNVLVTWMITHDLKLVTSAASGIAATLLFLGQTTHHRFKLPLTPHKDSVCNFKKESEIGKFLSDISLGIIDEGPMLNDRIPSTTPGAEPPRDARDSGSARSHSTHLETSSSDRP